MAKENKNQDLNKPAMNNKVLIYVIIAIIILLIIFFVFKGINKPIEKQATGKASDIDNIDIGANPDIAVDDFDSLQVSQEDIST